MPINKHIRNLIKIIYSSSLGYLRIPTNMALVAFMNRGAHILESKIVCNLKVNQCFISFFDGKNRQIKK